MTAEHAQHVLYTEGGRTQCQHDLNILATHGYLSSLPRARPTDPAVYLFDRYSVRGNRLMRARYGEDEFRRHLTALGSVEHLLRTNDLRAHFDNACRTLGWALSWYRTEELQELSSLVGLIPDGYFKVVRPSDGGPRKSGFFVELERAEKSSRVVQSKLERYRELHQRHHDYYSQRFGTESLRVLVVFAGIDARSVKHRIDAGVRDADRLGFGRARFCGLDEISNGVATKCLFGTVWRAPGEPEPVPLFPVSVMA